MVLYSPIISHPTWTISSFKIMPVRLFMGLPTYMGEVLCTGTQWWLWLLVWVFWFLVFLATKINVFLLSKDIKGAKYYWYLMGISSWCILALWTMYISHLSCKIPTYSFFSSVLFLANMNRVQLTHCQVKESILFYYCFSINYCNLILVFIEPNKLILLL